MLVVLGVFVVSSFTATVPAVVSNVAVYFLAGSMQLGGGELKSIVLGDEPSAAGQAVAPAAARRRRLLVVVAVEAGQHEQRHDDHDDDDPEVADGADPLSALLLGLCSGETHLPSFSLSLALRRTHGGEKLPGATGAGGIRARQRIKLGRSRAGRTALGRYLRMNTTADGEGPSAFSVEVGQRLRAVRRARRLSLDDVERTSGGRWSASAVGAYERGFRNLSLPRLRELALFYDVPMSVLLGEPAGREQPAPASTSRLVIDLEALDRTPDAAPIVRYLQIDHRRAG